MSDTSQRSQSSARGRKATIKDVARLAGVSVATVSRALNANVYVRPDTRQRIDDAVSQLQYAPNMYARSLAGVRSRVFCALFDNPRGDYVSAILRGALKGSEEIQVHLVLETLERPGMVRKLTTILDQVQPDGVILTSPLCDDQALLHCLKERGVEAVQIAPTVPFDRMALVGIDDYGAARSMTLHLIGLGHTKIGFVTGDPAHGASQKRLRGYKDALRTAGYAVDDQLIEEGFFSFESGVAATEKLLAVKTPPTVIFACNDEMAAGALSVLHREGLAVPGDIAVAGFDDGALASYVWPSLTTVRQPVEALGHQAVTALMEKLSTPDDPAPSHMLSFEIIERQST